MKLINLILARSWPLISICCWG